MYFHHLVSFDPQKYVWKKAYPVASLSQTGGTTPRLSRQALNHVRPDANGPGGAEHDGEEVDADDDDPAAGAAVSVHRARGVQGAHEQHDGKDEAAADERRRLAAPAVGHERRGKGDSHDEQRRDARRQEAGPRRRDAGLLEQAGRVVEDAVDAAELLHRHCSREKSAISSLQSEILYWLPLLRSFSFLEPPLGGNVMKRPRNFL